MSRPTPMHVPRWLKPFLGHQAVLVSRDANVFGRWAVVKWPAMPPEAPVHQYVAWWQAADDHVRKAPPQPTYQAAVDLIPITN